MFTNDTLCCIEKVNVRDASGLFVLNHIHLNKHLSICVIRFVIRSEKMR